MKIHRKNVIFIILIIMLFLVLYELFISFYTHKRALFVGDTVRPGGVISYYLNKRTLIKRIKNTDRIVVYEPPNRNVQIQYVGAEVQQIIKAIKNSHPDNGIYDTLMLYIIEFYENNNKLARIGTCGDLFIFDGKQYRAPKGVLERFVDSALDKLQARSRRKSRAT